MATLAATLTGTVPTLFAYLDRDERKAMVWRYGIKSLMVAARLRLFPTVAALAKSGNVAQLDHALSAVEAMPEWTDADRKVICPWLMGFLEHPKGAVQRHAGGLLVNCKGAYLDAVLDKGQKALEAGGFKLTRPFATVFAKPCASSSGPGTPEQCKRLFSFLKAGVAHEEVDWKVRGHFVDFIDRQFTRDRAMLDLMRTYEKSGDRRLARGEELDQDHRRRRRRR